MDPKDGGVSCNCTVADGLHINFPRVDGPPKKEPPNLNPKGHQEPY